MPTTLTRTSTQAASLPLCLTLTLICSPPCMRHCRYYYPHEDINTSSIVPPPSTSSPRHTTPALTDGGDGRREGGIGSEVGDGRGGGERGATERVKDCWLPAVAKPWFKAPLAPKPNPPLSVFEVAPTSVVRVDKGMCVAVHLSCISSWLLAAMTHPCIHCYV